MFKPFAPLPMLRQTHGCGRDAEHLYSLARPFSAEISDGEAFVLTNDPVFGSGWVSASLDAEIPASMIGGLDLNDPASAVIVTWNGYVILLRPDGRTDIEKIPGVGDPWETDEDGDYGIGGPATVHVGKLFVAASEGRIFVRESLSQYRLLTESLRVPPDAPTSEAVFFDALTAAEDGVVVAVGRRDMGAHLFEGTLAGPWSARDFDGRALKSAATSPDGRVWIGGGNGQVYMREAGETDWRTVPPGGETRDIVAMSATTDSLIGVVTNGATIGIGSDGFGRARPIPANGSFITRGFFEGDDLFAYGENGFARFDGTEWNAIPVPWA